MHPDMCINDLCGSVFCKVPLVVYATAPPSLLHIGQSADLRDIPLGQFAAVVAAGCCLLST